MSVLLTPEMRKKGNLGCRLVLQDYILKKRILKLIITSVWEWLSDVLDEYIYRMHFHIIDSNTKIPFRRNPYFDVNNHFKRLLPTPATIC